MQRLKRSLKQVTLIYTCICIRDARGGSFRPRGGAAQGKNPRGGGVQGRAGQKSV